MKFVLGEHEHKAALTLVSLFVVVWQAIL